MWLVGLLVIAGIWLVGRQSRFDAIALLLIGSGLLLDIRGYGSAAVAWYKRNDATNVYTRNLPGWLLRLVFGGLFVGTGIIFLQDALSHL